MATPRTEQPWPATKLRDSTSPFPLRLADTWIGDVAVVSNGGEPMTASMGGAKVALLIVALLPLALLGLGLLLGAEDFARVMGILAAIFVPLAAYIWWAARRYWRFAELINRGELDRARRALDGKRSAALGPLIGLLAQLRADHEGAVAGYSRTIATFDGPAARLPALSAAAATAQAAAAIAAATPTTRVTVLRGAMAYASVGRVDTALDLLSSGRAEGSYDGAIEAVAAAYITVCAGQPPFPSAADTTAMAAAFREIRGAWGGLTLAAYGLRQLGDAAAAAALLEEEATRPGAEWLPALFPRLRRFIESRGAVLD